MSVLRNLVPAPLTSAALLASWLVLARSTSAGQVLVALGLALAIPILGAKLRLAQLRVRRPLVAARYVLRVCGDVLRANFEIACDVLAWRWRQPHARFVIIPLELRDPVGLAALSMVTTIVPGTVWSELALDRSALLLHVWDVADEGDFVARFKSRYEQPLREIFE